MCRLMFDGLVGLLQDGPISGLDVVENRKSFVRGFVIWLVRLWVEVLVGWSMGQLVFGSVIRLFGGAVSRWVY